VTCQAIHNDRFRHALAMLSFRNTLQQKTSTQVTCASAPKFGTYSTLARQTSGLAVGTALRISTRSNRANRKSMWTDSWQSAYNMGANNRSLCPIFGMV
jgi:hypothetical protein